MKILVGGKNVCVTYFPSNHKDFYNDLIRDLRIKKLTFHETRKIVREKNMSREAVLNKYKNLKL